AEATNPRFNFLAQKLYDHGRARIANGLPKGPFTGVPWLLKDLNTHIAGERTGQGSRFYSDYRAPETSEIVRRHEAAGLVIFGKTTTPEFGLSATTESRATGATRNPRNPDHIAGGSSGGAAAAIAAGVLPAAHATDGGGSIRIPASCCGLFGFKPSRGRVPMGPPRTEGWGGLSVHHAITRSVRDSAALLDATHGLELGSRYGAPAPVEGFLAQVTKRPGRLKIALILAPPGGTAVDPECIAAARAAARLCEDLGHIVEEAAPRLDEAAIGQASFVLIASSVAADIEDRAKRIAVEPSTEMLEAVTLMFHAMGRQTSGMDFVRANNVMQAAAIDMARFMGGYDVILSPTLAAPPVRIGLLGLSPDTDMAAWGKAVAEFSPFTGVYNATGQPSMSVPLGMSAAGLPIGVMFSARYGEEATLFRLAGQIERAAPWAETRIGP
ncbi:MAG: amidase, partial [Sphingomonadaceae bacterium]